MYNGKLCKIKPLDITIMVDFEIILNNKYLKNEILIMFLLTHGYPMKALRLLSNGVHLGWKQSRFWHSYKIRKFSTIRNIITLAYHRFDFTRKHVDI